MTIDDQARAQVEQLLGGSSLSRAEVRRVRDQTPAEVRDELLRIARAEGLISAALDAGRAQGLARTGGPGPLERLAEVVDTFDGRVLDRSPTTLVAAFLDVRDAFAVALSSATPGIKLAVHAYPAQPPPCRPPAVAVDEVSLLGRIGHGGQVLVSAGARYAVGRLLPTDARLEEVGTRPVDDPGAPEAVFALRHHTLPLSFPPPAGGGSGETRPLVGRDTLLGDIVDSLRPGAVVTLVGDAGVGKTRLAEEAANRYERGAALDGVVACSLAGVRSERSVVERLAAALPTPTAAEAPDLQTKVLSSLRGRFLVVLDRCDDLDPPARQLVRSIVGTGSEAAVLATSRTPVGLADRAADEHLVGPLRCAEDDDAPSPARTLLLQLSGADDAVSAAGLEDVTRRLGAVPLAIELVAPFLDPSRPNPGVTEIARQLARGADTQGDVVATALRLAVERLGQPVAEVFAACSTFAGGWRRESAEAVAAAAGLDPSDTRRALAHLERHAIVRREGSADGAPARFRMPDSVQARGAALLASDTVRAAAVGSAHADLFTELVASAAGPRRTQAEGAWVQAVDADFDNVRVAHRWLAEHDRPNDALRMVWLLGDDALMRGRHEVGHWAQSLGREAVGAPMRGAALAVGSNTALIEGDHRLASELAEEALGAGPTDGADGRWVAVNTQALVAFRSGDQGSRQRLLARVVELGEESGNAFAQVVARYETVMLSRLGGDPEAGQIAASSLRKLVGPRSSPSMLAMAELGEGMTITGDPRRAQRHIERGMALASSVRNTLLFLQGWRAARALDFDLPERVAAVRDLRDVARQFAVQGNASEHAQTLAAILLHLVELGHREEAATICVHLSRTPFRDSVWLRLVKEQVRVAFGPGIRPEVPAASLSASGEGLVLDADDVAELIDSVIERLPA